MVTVYTWLPTPALTVITKGLMPDLGHSSLHVHDDNRVLTDAYVSFWPQMDSTLRQIINLWKNRKQRFPSCYAEDSDTETGFMQRPADYAVSLTGLHEDRIRRGWVLLQGSDFDVVSWNCANITQCLLIAAMDRERYECVQDAVECRLSRLDKDKMDADEMGVVLRHLAASELFACQPEEVHRLAVAYKERVCPEDTPVPQVKILLQAGGNASKSEP